MSLGVVIVFGIIGFLLMKGGFGPMLFGFGGIFKVGAFLFMFMIGWIIGGFIFGF